MSKISLVTGAISGWRVIETGRPTGRLDAPVTSLGTGYTHHGIYVGKKT
jgi:hypothetical protein